MADAAGALLTLLALAALGAGGYLLALRLLGAARAASDALGLASASLLAATALGTGIALALGAAGALRVELALPLAAAACAVAVVAPRRLTWAAAASPARRLAGRLWARVREHPALSILALHAVGNEALRGLIRPPLSWDSLMYHLLLTGTWLQRHDLAPVFGAYPTNFYGYSPANGSVWLWWWMAPSHSELYANLAFLPQWALLALATGAVARRLGAVRSWPLAAFAIGMTPVVVRFLATQYVDIFTAACLVAACACGLSWMRDARRGDAVLAGAGIGLAAGAKVLGLVYAGALGAALLALAPGAWRRRTPQAAAALAAALALGAFFYVRNVAHGAGPLALQCEGLPHTRPVGGLPPLPRPNSVAALPHQMLVEGRLASALLGTGDPANIFEDLGLGPEALLVLAGIPALAVLAATTARAARGGVSRRAAAVVASQVVVEAAFWATVPYAANGHVWANVRYLLPAAALALAGALAAAEGFGAPERWLRWIVLALVAQDLLQLHAQLPDGVRIAAAAADALAVALALSPRLRGLAARRLPAVAPAALAAAALAAIAVAPWLASFRAADRRRAFVHEWTAHGTTTPRYAGAWDWLDRHGGAGTVAVVSSPDTFFIYPAMGPHLERRALYVNVNAANLADAAAYPLCQPRVAADPAAWIANLRREEVRWLHVSRTPPYPFPMEDGWARARPDLFVQRYADSANAIYQVLPATPGQQAPGARTDEPQAPEPRGRQQTGELPSGLPPPRTQAAGTAAPGLQATRAPAPGHGG